MRSLFIYILLFLPIICFSQECQWIETQNNGSGQVITTSVATDKYNNVITGGRYIVNELLIDSDTLSEPGNAFLAKYDKDGGLVWSKTIAGGGQFTYTFNGFTNVIVDSFGNIFCAGVWGRSDSLIFSNNVKLYKPSGNYSQNDRAVFIVKFDSTGNALWANFIYGGLVSFQYELENWGSEFGQVFKPGITLDNSGNLIFSVIKSSEISTTLVNFTDTIISVDEAGLLLIKYSPLGELVWVNQIKSSVNSGSTKVSSITYSEVVFDNNQFLYLTLFGGGNIIINSDTFSGTAYRLIIKIDSIGIITKSKKVIEYDNINLKGPTPGAFAVMGKYIVSISDFQSTSLICDSILLINNNNKYLLYIAFFDKELNFITSFQTDSNSTANTSVYGSSTYDNFLYLGGFMDQGSVGIGGFTLTNTSTDNNLFLAKMDTLGNVLWAFSNDRSTANAFDIATDTRGDVYVVGNFNDSIHIFNESAGGATADGYLAKITDYSITRGEVSSGPYCAGDSILIPYTRMGPFEPDNEFIAELSDENGNFDGGQRELGRLKTTEDSTIIGALPLFEVSSSANYRIRIRSTHPPVQSFFRRDSLRLLIYSRDKADPGPPETVCFGDSFRLNTFGGTAWEWSPAYRMDNPNARSPLIYPDRDTLFRIVISDSSGCGEPDTAFKQIFIRPKAQIQTQTLVNACWGLPVNLTANFTQGDSSQYRWTWFSTENPTLGAASI
jgi:hypothetical protein